MDGKTILRPAGMQMTENDNAELLNSLEIVGTNNFSSGQILLTGSTNVESIGDHNKNTQVQIIPEHLARQCFIENGADENLIAIPFNLLQINESMLSQPMQTYANVQHHKKDITSNTDSVVKQYSTIAPETSNQHHIIIKANSNIAKNYILSPFAVSNFNEHSGISVIDGGDLDKSITAETVVGGGQVFLHLEENSVSNFKTAQNHEVISTDMLLAADNFKEVLSGKQLEQVTLIDDQVMLTSANQNLENSLIVCREDMSGTSLNIIDQCLEKQSIFDESIPDEKTITLDSNIHCATIQSQLISQSKKGPFTCGKCNISFEKSLHFKKHILEHILEKPYKCAECTEVFSNATNLKLHIAIHNHENLVCPVCNKSFRRHASFKAHLPIHEEDEITSCSVCGEEFFSFIKLKSHVLDHWLLFSTENVSIYQNEELAPTMEETTSHFECNVCFKDFESAVSYKNHMGIHKRFNQYPAKKRKLNGGTAKMVVNHTCDICHKSFIKPSQLVRHTRIHTGERPFTCTHPGCDRSFTQKGTLSVHMEIHNENREMEMCQICGKRFSQKSNLRHHMLKLHPPNTDPNVSNKCPICSCVFSKASSLSAHITRRHAPSQIVISSTDTLLRKDIESQIEDYQTTKLEYPFDQTNQKSKESSMYNYNVEDYIKLDAHKDKMNIKDRDAIKDDGEFLQVVTVLDKLSDKYTRRFPLLVRHYKGSKWHVCPFTNCRKEFKKASDIIKHIRIHTKERPFKCHFCLRAFSSKASLKLHIRTHFRKKEFVCKDCGKSFYTPRTLKVHSWIHTGQKAYICSVCGRNFRTLSQKKCHMLTHKQSPHSVHMLKKRNYDLTNIPLREPMLITNEGPVNLIPRTAALDTNLADRPHRCCYCRASFKKSSHLILHERAHTGERPYKCDMCFKTFSCNSTLKNHQKVHEAGSSHKCEICHRMLACKGSLKRHLSTHSGVRPYLCPYCNRTFKTIATCRRHMRVHRGWIATMPEQQEETHFANSMMKQENLYTLNQNEVTPESKDTCLEYERSIQIGDTVKQNTINGGLTLLDIMPVSQSNGDNQTKTSVSDSQIVIPSESLKITGDAGMQHLILPEGTIFTTSDRSDISGNVLVTERDGIDGTIYEVSSEGSSDPTIMLGKNISGELHDISFSQGDNFTSTMTDDKIMESCENAIVTQCLPNDSETYVIQEGLQMPNGDKNEVITTDGEFIYVQHKTIQKVTTIPKEDLNISAQNLVHIIDSNDNRNSVNDCNQNPLEEDSHIFFAKPIEEETESQTVKFTDKQPLYRESDGKEAENFSCSQCPKTFKKECHLNSHSDVHNMNVKRCPKCKQTFPNGRLLKEHVKEKHSTRICYLCKVRFTSEAFLLEHIRKEHRGDCLEGQESLLADAQDHRIWRCPICPALFRSHTDIKHHLETVHSQQEVKIITTDQNDVTLITSIDNSVSKQTIPDFPISATLVNPLAGKTSEGKRKTGRRSKDTVPRSSADNTCHVCQKAFRKSSDLSRHARIHTGEKPYECGICSKKFALKSTLVVHEKSHVGKRNHKCDICNEMYSTVGSLRVHQRIHTGEKPLKCYFCELQFRTSSKRKLHMASHFRMSKQTSGKPNTDANEEATNTDDVKTDSLSLDTSNSENVENMYTVTMNEDGSLSLELGNGILDVGTMLNGARTDIDISAVDPVYTFSLEIPNDDSGNSIQNDVSLNQNIMAEQDEMVEFSNSKSKDAEIINLSYSNNEYVTDSQQMQIFPNQTSDLVSFTDEGAELQCETCLATFPLRQLSDFQEHVQSHRLPLHVDKGDKDSERKNSHLQRLSVLKTPKLFEIPDEIPVYKCHCGKSFKSNSILQVHKSSYACRPSLNILKSSPFKAKSPYASQLMSMGNSGKKLKGINLSMKALDEESMDISSSDMSDILMMND